MKRFAHIHPALFALAAPLVAIALAQAEPKVWFGNLKDGAKVTSPFEVTMKAKDLVVEPAAKGVVQGHGHFHIIIDRPLPDTGMPIPKDSLHIHYGGGQTETILDLPMGEHSLALQFAKGDHTPYSPQVIQEIRIEVTGMKSAKEKAALEKAAADKAAKAAKAAPKDASKDKPAEAKPMSK